MPTTRNSNSSKSVTTKNSNTSAEDKQDKPFKIKKDSQNCGSCNIVVRDDEAAIECELCRFWFHCTCQNVSKKLYDTISDPDCDALHWYCRTCNGTAGNMLIMMTSLQSKQSKLQLEMNGLKDEMKDCKIEIVDSQQRIEKTLEEFKQEISDREDSSLHCSMDKVEKLFTDKLEDFEEREKRKNNLIIFGIPESHSLNPESRKKEDLDNVYSIFHRDLDVKSQEVKTLYRLGKKSDSPRPLKVVMGNEATREEILREARKIRLNTVQINKDFTKTERSEYKRLKKEMLERTEKGEENLVIRRGKITKRIFRRDKEAENR